jgi:transposase
MTRRYARAPRGERAYASAPHHARAPVTVVAGLGLRGVVAPAMWLGPIDGASFDAYVAQQLAPAVRPGDVVVLDRLGAHCRASVRAALAARGVRLLLLPPYGPDLSPVEACFSKLKTWLRAAAVRTYAALLRAVAAGFDAVTRADIRGWFKHYGYGFCHRLR